MNVDFKNWHEQLLDMDTAVNHHETLAEIELLILENSAADCRRLRIKTFWLLRHLAKLM